MIMLVFGCVLVGGAAILDSFFRARMSRVGYKRAILQGGTFDYRQYRREAKQRGWSVWPLNLMWAAIVLGIGLIIGGFFALFGLAPMSSK